MYYETKFERFKTKARFFALDCLTLGAKSVALAFVLYQFGSHNGCIDSRRTLETRALRDEDNITKTVADVYEEWSDNEPLAIFGGMGGGAYNPQVRRTVWFEDGTKTILSYRTVAHQPIKRWVSGDEFNPRRGEIYEVTPDNEFVRLVE